MATAVEHRGQGHGLALLQAAEQLVAALGEREMYLHLRCGRAGGRAGGWLLAEEAGTRPALRSSRRPTLPARRRSSPAPNPPARLRCCRVQDTPAARLYEKARFEQVAADSFLVRLLGWDQRRLMRKRLEQSAGSGAASWRG